MTRQRRPITLLTGILVSLAMLAASGCMPVVDPASLPPDSRAGSAPSAVEIYQSLAPSVAYIDTPAGTGSGLLIQLADQRYIVTNAHVVWPFTSVRVVFPDGKEYSALPVLAEDQLVDLAILGPVETSLTPVDISVPEDPQPGESVYLIGYPGEGELFPVPAITEGILSRTRVWHAVDSLRYFQTDAAGAGGQSGGVLVSRQGDVVGISGMLFSDVFVLAASSQDLSDRLNKMLATAASSPVEDEPQPATGRRVRHELDSLWDTDGYFVYAAPGTELEITATSRSDLALTLFDAGPGEIAYADNSFEGSETVSATVSIDAPNIFVVAQFLPGPATYQLQSSHVLEPIRESDDGQSIEPGQTLTGTLDYPADIDWFVIELSAGDVITVTADAAGIDTVLTIGPRGQSADAYVEDDDSGRGILGSNAAIVYVAERTGEHLIVVRSFATDDVGGYLLSVGAGE